ncbi:hypothetical protein KC332_g1185 [Hortaea werneckii]|nr:hypothetical protein KC350_g5445 [Hortaea werneckii]KAI6843286.1 hypothetical protein KC358_g3899 [Hortaea werneckii]KAI6936947.1 hypothetical protein KC341_g5909 [Hortaea werneckii]KAI6944034.1 hypothetical protein KC348_g4093 [Hortaea werneckii]KAI6976651.1 hypothetical protein KC321_g3888 [Hortaea werneckii]
MSVQTSINSISTKQKHFAPTPQKYLTRNYSLRLKGMKWLSKISDAVVKNAWKKLANPTVGRGKTAWPKSQADLLKYGIRLDYDGVVNVDGVEFYKYQCQPNAGKVASSVRDWRDKNGGTHAVITSVLVKKGGTEKDVEDAVGKAFKEA